MADPAPQTKDWKAWQNLQPGPSTPTLMVVGQVETSNTNQTPRLSEHAPQGINRTILLLDLTISAAGAGNDVMSWREVRFEKAIEKNQYSSVDVLWEGAHAGSAEVEDVH